MNKKLSDSKNFNIFAVLKNREQEIMIFIAIGTFIALGFELVMLCQQKIQIDLQNQQIISQNKLEHFKRKTELIQFLFDTKSTDECGDRKDCLKLPKYNSKIRSKAFVEYVENYSLEDNDLSGALLSDIKINHLKWSRDFEVNLAGADLSEADLQFLFLPGANFTNANLTGADLNSSLLEDGNFEGANLSGVNLALAFLGNTNFKRANLSEANLVGARLIDVNFFGANLSKAHFAESELENSSFFGANLTGVDLQRLGFDNIDFRKADLTEASLYRSDMSNANFTGATFHRTKYSPSSHIESVFDPSEILRMRKASELICIMCENELNKFEKKIEFPSIPGL
ncbi:MAG: pentapeptide repeat-containing protein [Candidatus Caenarcaniphilales bacterium]|nr:pentapeptide repeat-containing protein [Candidatus Caenarcaniphilales bacterium]